MIKKSSAAFRLPDWGLELWKAGLVARQGALFVGKVRESASAISLTDRTLIFHLSNAPSSTRDFQRSPWTLDPPELAS